jgi:hypothetical protein
MPLHNSICKTRLKALMPSAKQQTLQLPHSQTAGIPTSPPIVICTNLLTYLPSNLPVLQTLDCITPACLTPAIKIIMPSARKPSLRQLHVPLNAWLD